VSELARRLCRAEHTVFPGGNTAPEAVPCGRHVELAGRYYGLTQASGRAILAVLVEAAGLSIITDEQWTTPAG
jgi:hypothetical protein